MYSRVAIIVGCILLLPSVKTEAQALDGSFFLQSCGAAVRMSDGQKLGPDETMASIFCTAYVSGFLDSMSITSGVLKAQRPVCLPEKGITNDQGIRIFVKYLRQNPEVLNESGRMSLMVSLKNAFPCGK
jgi:hypothetical protein